MTMQKLFKEKCDELFLPLGFHRHKNRYWRVAGEMYQALSFGLSPWGFKFITFDVLPLCMGLNPAEQLAADGERNSLDILSLTETNWSFFKNQPETIPVAIDSIADVMQSRLIPFFEHTTSCLDAYDEIHRLYQHQQKYSLAKEDFGESFEHEVWYFQDERFHILLKLGRLEEAQNLKLAHKKVMEDVHQRGWPLELKMFGEEKAMQRQIASLAPIEAAIELTKHPEQVQPLLAENERKSRKAFQLPLDKKELKRSFMDDKARILCLVRLQELLYPLGFQYYNKRFWRVAGELYQSLSFRMTDHVCQVFFGLKPLCMNVSLSKELVAEHEPYDLQVLSHAELDWSLDGNCKETVVVKVGAQTLFRACPQTISAAVDSISGVIRSELIPFLERTTTCVNAYQELLNLNCGMPETLRFYMLLKLGRLEEAATFAPAGTDAALSKHSEQVQLLLTENERTSRIAFGLEEEESIEGGL